MQLVISFVTIDYLSHFSEYFLSLFDKVRYLINVYSLWSLIDTGKRWERTWYLLGLLKSCFLCILFSSFQFLESYNLMYCWAHKKISWPVLNMRHSLRLFSVLSHFKKVQKGNPVPYKHSLNKYNFKHFFAAVTKTLKAFRHLISNIS